MKTMITLVASIVTVSIAQADLYSDRASVYNQRAQMAQEQELQQAIARRRALIDQASAELFGKMKNFIGAHKGLAAEAVCTADIPRCASGESCIRGEDQQIPYSQVRTYGFSLSSCNVELNDGLACLLKRGFDYRNGKVISGFEADCYDPGKNRHYYFFPEGTKKRAVTKRRAR